VGTTGVHKSEKKEVCGQPTAEAPERGRVMAVAVGGGLIFNRAPALLRRAFCVVRAPRPKSRRPEKVGTPERSAASFVRGGARPPPRAHHR
jgi:hypothetical protein